MAIQRLSLEDGKYIFEFEEIEAGKEYKPLRCLRHGKPWREFIGDNAVMALFNYAVLMEAKFNKLIELTTSHLDRQQASFDRLKKRHSDV